MGGGRSQYGIQCCKYAFTADKIAETLSKLPPTPRSDVNSRLFRFTSGVFGITSIPCPVSTSLLSFPPLLILLQRSRMKYSAQIDRAAQIDKNKRRNTQWRLSWFTRLHVSVLQQHTNYTHTGNFISCTSHIKRLVLFLQSKRHHLYQYFQQGFGINLQILVHFDFIASHNFCRFLKQESKMQLAWSATILR